MESFDLILQIRASYNQFTKAEKKIADYCLNHREEIPYLSITELADACQVGDTSVYRFCRSLKLEGYQDFKMRFYAFANWQVSSEPGTKSLAERILAAHQNAVAETYALLHAEQLEKIVSMLDNAEKVYFFGVGDSLLAAKEAYNRFLRITPKVNCISDPHMQSVAAALASKNDLFFLISYSGSTKDTVHTARLAKERGARVACISHFQKSPLTGYCDAVLLCGSKEDPFNRGSASAKAGQLYLIDLLYQSLYELHPEEASRCNALASASVLEMSL